MRFLEQFRLGDMRLNRIEAFSDGVFAIVVTLLVLELKVPLMSASEATSVKELAHHLAELAPKLLSWLISFLIVCKFWLNHHHLLGLARHADYGMVWLNSLFLMSQAFIPFPTALMGEYPDNPLAVSLFGAVMSISTFFFIALQRYILRNLVRPEYEGVYSRRSLRLGLLGPFSYLLGAGAAWISGHVAFILYMVTPLYSIIPPQGKMKTTDVSSDKAPVAGERVEVAVAPTLEREVVQKEFEPE